MKRVSFSHSITFVYTDDETNKKGIWETYALDRFRFLDRIKKFDCKYVKMNSIEQLLKECFKEGSSTIVLGNLGRRPSLLIYYFNLLFKDLTILIRSRWKVELEMACDMLIWLEPEFECVVEKPYYAKSMIVFTSHLNLNHNTNVIGYHLGDMCTHFDFLIERKKDSKNNVLKNKSYVILHPGPFQSVYEEIPPNSKVVINLTFCKDSHETYIFLMNSLEILNYYYVNVKSWRIYVNSNIAFSEDMLKCYEKLKDVTFTSATTTNIDKLSKSHFLLHNFENYHY